MEKNYQIPRMSYEEIREHMSENLRNGKRRMLTEKEIKAVVDQWVDSRSEEELDQQIVQNEIRKLEKSWKDTMSHLWGTWRSTKKKGGAESCTASSTMRLQAQCDKSRLTE